MTDQELDCGFHVQVALLRIYLREKFLTGVGDGEENKACRTGGGHVRRPHFVLEGRACSAPRCREQNFTLFDRLQHKLLGTNLVLMLVIS